MTSWLVGLGVFFGVAWIVGMSGGVLGEGELILLVVLSIAAGVAHRRRRA